MYDKHYLTPLFEPQSVVVIGASERPGAIGGMVLRNIVEAGYRGKLYAVNPKHAKVSGVRCYSSVADLPEKTDLAVVATPAQAIAAVIEACGKAGIRAAVVITAGFAEIGPAGKALQEQFLAVARRYGVRIVGPNCLGIMRPQIGLNATFARGGAQDGALALVSQSGALATAIIDWANPSGVGFSSVISLGGSVDIDFGEILDYLVADGSTQHILLYIEGVRDARRFMSALRAASRVKPVIVLKVGRHLAGTRAAVSHTGALVGADDVFDSALARAGAVRVTTIGQLFAVAQGLTARIRPRGNRLAIITNGGGPGAMAADRAADLGVRLADLSPHTLTALDAVLPSNWSHGNPLDLIGDADALRHKTAVAAALADENVDGVLAMMVPTAVTETADAARAVIEAAQGSDKPLITCWMGEQLASAGRRLFAEKRIPTFRTPEPAVELFSHLAAYTRNRDLLMQTPGPLAQAQPIDAETARRIIEHALAEGRNILTSGESKELLHACGIPVNRSERAATVEEAERLAAAAGTAVAMKIDSPDITHKSDVGGVRLNLKSAHAVRGAWVSMMRDVAAAQPRARITGVTIEKMIRRESARELLLGVSQDKVFGPVMTFGAGGTAVEVLRDRAVALPPLNAMLIANMIASTRVSKMLGEFRGAPAVNGVALESALLRLSEMVCELPWIRELDINPLLADAAGVVAVDARVVVAAVAPGTDRYARLAIHPYPSRLAHEWALADGTMVSMRPIRPEDAQMEMEFVRELSAESRYFRFMDTMRELTPDLLARFTQIDYDREMAFVTTIRKDGAELEIAVGRYATNPDGASCEFAVVVGDRWQGRGLASAMLKALIAVARERGLHAMMGHIMAGNDRMLKLAQELGFCITTDPHDSSLRQAVLNLRAH